MSVQDAVKKVTRVDHALAVQFVAGDVDVEALIRGWIPNLPEDLDLSSALEDGTWIVKSRVDGNVYPLTQDQFEKAGFKIEEQS